MTHHPTSIGELCSCFQCRVQFGDGFWAGSLVGALMALECSHEVIFLGCFDDSAEPELSPHHTRLPWVKTLRMVAVVDGHRQLLWQFDLPERSQEVKAKHIIYQIRRVLIRPMPQRRLGNRRETISVEIKVRVWDSEGGPEQQACKRPKHRDVADCQRGLNIPGRFCHKG